MSDPMTPEVRDWMKRTDVEPPDANESARQVRARLPGVRQRRRWWPFPVFYRQPETPANEHPTSTPASNGHTPTAIGRTTSMLSPAKAITAGAIVFAIGGTFLIAQPFDQQDNPPGAAVDPCTTPITPVSGRVTWGTTTDEVSPVFIDATTHREVVHISRWDMDDDRLDGEQEFHAVWDTNGMSGVHSGTIRVENADGAWSGTVYGVGPSMATWQEFISLTGEGAYAGLSANLFGRSGSGGGPLEGAIYPTDLASCDSASMP